MVSPVQYSLKIVRVQDGHKCVQCTANNNGKQSSSSLENYRIKKMKIMSKYYHIRMNECHNQ
ncbi:hypothetical protein DERP_001882 [Dermatophagoides pteronyssinus]|uniref:Uncharacterized protein n=1 Tax=Dermatophagoides pteronyssinus TaxID=6956 RepID=A0ABQ8JCA6_DERPT|nr:hypothetical protein DERP_001882 [Dermatophagoides pteronyssinus]